MNQLTYPERESEFEVQAELYMALKSEGFHVRGEVLCPFPGERKNGRVRLDIVVFDTLRSAVVIVECKNSVRGMQKLGARQERRYNTFGVPVLLCDNSSAIPRTVQAVNEISDALESSAS